MRYFIASCCHSEQSEASRPFACAQGDTMNRKYHYLSQAKDGNNGEIDDQSDDGGSQQI